MAVHNKSAAVHVRRQRGGLSIWGEEPKAGEVYTIGIDSSEGIRGGDYSCAQVVANSDCRQAAMYHGLYDPNEWGRLTVQLGRHFNDAMLAYEVGASTHGTTAALCALNLGYPNLYRRRILDAVEKKWTNRLGWETKERTKRQLLDRIRYALAQGTVIADAETVRELLGGRVVEGGVGGNKIEFAGHDDRVIALGIALVVRDDTWSEGGQHDAEEKLTDPSDLHWQEFERSFERGSRFSRQPANPPG